MEHSEYLVDVLDEQGQVVGQTPRRALNKRIEVFHGVHVVLVTAKREIVVSMIPHRQDLPNLYAGLLGTTMATIRHHGEVAIEAAVRGLRHELLLSPKPSQLKCIHDGMVHLDDGRTNYLTAYMMKAERPELYQLAHIGELMLITPEGLELAMGLHADRFSPTLKAIWPRLLAVSMV